MILIAFLLFLFHISSAQKQDYTWILGYSSSRLYSDTTIGTTIVRFADEQLRMTRDTIEANHNATSSLISDPKTGELILYSDGCRVWDHRHNRVKGLEEINRDSYFWGSYYGTNISQNILILPDPSADHTYRLIYLWFDKPKYDTVFRANKLRSTLVNVKDPDQSVVLHKDLDIYFESFSVIGITACRHANGRDWWIVVPTRHSHDKVVFLLDPEGLKFSNKYVSGLKSRTMGYGNAAFSPDGKTYGWLSEDDRALDGGFIELFDFDRCEGKLSNHRLKQQTGYQFQSGVYRIELTAKHSDCTNENALVKWVTVELCPDEGIPANCCVSAAFIYPNPSGDNAILHYTLEEETNLQIDITGINLPTPVTLQNTNWSAIGNYDLPLDLSPFPDGAYQVRLFLNQQEIIPINLIKQQ
ncbi:MAG: T9SS type A sorting domain-containing protein [Saprospiraceae bacterium]|nr:T9SS type A sorting domain-containing protein [Saprospiraceae bacterium]